MPAARRFTTYEKVETIPLIVIKKRSEPESSMTGGKDRSRDSQEPVT